MPPRALRLAHRGDHRRAPENSLAALRAAVEVAGIDGVEFDVRASADGIPVLLHDATLERVQGRPERARDLTAAELSSLGVPSLAAALAVVPPPAFLDIELKEDVAEATIEEIGAARGEDPVRVVLSSFEPAILERLAAIAPGWARWLNADRLDAAAIARARSLRCAGVSAGWRSIDARSVAAAAEAALEVAAWTVTSASEAARLDALGIVALCVEGEAIRAPT